MAETVPPMLLEATIVHVRMELEGKTAQKVNLEILWLLHLPRKKEGLFAEAGISF